MTEHSQDPADLETRMQRVLLDLQAEEVFNRIFTESNKKDWENYKEFIGWLEEQGFTHEEAETIFIRFKQASNLGVQSDG